MVGERGLGVEIAAQPGPRLVVRDRLNFLNKCYGQLVTHAIFKL